MTQEQLLNLVPASDIERAKELLSQNQSVDNHTPLIVKIILGIGAWASASFVLSFFAGSFYLFLKDFGVLVFSGAIIALAIFFGRVAKRQTPSMEIFVGQISLFLMLTGKLLMITGLVLTKIAQSADALIIFMAVITAGTYPFYKSAVDRFLSSVVTFSTMFITYQFMGLLFGASSGYENTTYIFSLWKIIPPEILVVAIFAFSVWVFLKRKKELFPLAYAAIVSCTFATSKIISYIQTVALTGQAPSFFTQMMTPQKLLFVMTVLVALYWHFKQTSKKLNIWAVLAVILIMLPINIASIMGLSYLALGRNFDDKKLQAMGYIIFAGGLSFFYYNLSTTLLYKSYILCLSGILILAAAYISRRLNHEN